MHNILHVIIEALGGILFLTIGISRQVERRKLIRAGKKPEGVMARNILIISGVCLLTFAIGVMIYGFNHT